MSRLRQSSLPGWAVAIALHAVVVGGLLLVKPPPRQAALHRPPVRVTLSARKPVAPPSQPEALKAAPLPEAPRPPRQARLRRTATRRAAAPAIAQATPPASPAPRPPSPRLTVSMSATVTSGGVAVPASASGGGSRITAVPEWARGEGSGARPGPAVQGSRPAGALEVVEAASPPRLVGQPSSDALRAAYPSQARVEGIEAEVGLKILVDASGRVAAVRLTRRAGSGFDEAAQRLVRGFRFEAGTDRQGKRVAIWIPWTYKFRLDG